MGREVDKVNIVLGVLCIVTNIVNRVLDFCIFGYSNILINLDMVIWISLIILAILKLNNKEKYSKFIKIAIIVLLIVFFITIIKSIVFSNVIAPTYKKAINLEDFITIISLITIYIS